MIVRMRCVKVESILRDENDLVGSAGDHDGRRNTKEILCWLPCEAGESLRVERKAAFTLLGDDNGRELAVTKFRRSLQK